jgi:hypothetical protein
MQPAGAYPKSRDYIDPWGLLMVDGSQNGADAVIAKKKTPVVVRTKVLSCVTPAA